MKAKELIRMGYPEGPILTTARAAAGSARMAGRSAPKVRSLMVAVLRDPDRFVEDTIFGKLATALQSDTGSTRKAGSSTPSTRPAPRDEARALDYKVWGDEIDEQTHRQMRNACRLPISVAAALMPDAHVGYGLPIGGVLATDKAVIPYAVGVDIACRMMMTVFDLPPEKLSQDVARFRGVLQDNTRFGVGAKWNPRREHPVMDDDWRVTPVTARLKDLAHQQLGTSGSGNHFAEFGEFELGERVQGCEPGRYLAVLSHSGSRGPGNKVATHYSKWAQSRCRDLPKELQHLAWLDLDGDGAEYWAAMQLMGRYASANHHVIHRQIVQAVGAPVRLQVENHHNFAWIERHGDRDVVVHRKGATPAGVGVLGIIPGSMTAPAFLIEGRGDPSSLHSASHGAGRRMSRKAAIRQFAWREINAFLADRGVTLLSAGLDEAPWVYKDIRAVMAAQRDLVRPLAEFQPRLVKMAPAGERPED